MISLSSLTMENDFRAWWEIPSIVHFCKIFNPICADLYPINITEFEHAVENNSDILTNMAIRFTKICGFYDPDTNKWWDFMKEYFRKKHIEYKFEYTLDLVTYFDDLTPKQKVETLYILCHMILDVAHIQNKLFDNRKIRNKLNVKPLGYDQYKSAYWYFGTTRLYREDFEKSYDISTNSVKISKSVLHSIEISPLTEPYPSGIFGSGKWNVICDDDIDSWYSFADTTKYNPNVNIRSLHKSVLKIIKNLPKIKWKRSHYKYIKSPQTQLQLKNVCTMSLRSKNVSDDKNDLISKNLNNDNTECLNNVNITQTKYEGVMNSSQLDKTKSNEIASNLVKLPSIDMNENCCTNKVCTRSLRSMNVTHNENNLISKNLNSGNHTECLNNVNITQTNYDGVMNSSQLDKNKSNEIACDLVNLTSIDMTENCSTNKICTRSLRSMNVTHDEQYLISKNLNSGNHTECLNNVNVTQTKYNGVMNSSQFDKTKINENKQIKKSKNETAMKLRLKNVGKNKLHNINNSSIYKLKQECLKNVVRINLMRCDQEYSQNVENLGQKLGTSKTFKSETKLINSQIDKIKINKDKQIKKSKNERAMKLRLINFGKNKMHNINSFGITKMKQECLKNVVRINLMRCDQEYPQNVENLEKKIQTSKTLRSGTKLIKSWIDKTNINKNKQIKKSKNQRTMQLRLKNVGKNKMKQKVHE